MAGKAILTYEGLKKLEEELGCAGPKRMAIKERIKAALSHGDITENSEYDEAKMNRHISKVRSRRSKQCSKMQ